jgi:hypothetical protein
MWFLKNQFLRLHAHGGHIICCGMIIICCGIFIYSVKNAKLAVVITMPIEK